MTVIIRADASPHIGTGHIMRCLALAQAAQDVAMDVTIVGRISVPWVRERLNSEGIPFVVIDDTLQEAEDPVALLQQLCLATLEHYDSNPKSTWVVLDGYHFGPDCHKAVMAAGYKLLVIDDYNHLPEYHCDILLNQNVGAQQFAYKGPIAQKNFGFNYVLLRREFLLARSKALMRLYPDVPQKILVNLGGGDCSEHLSTFASVCNFQRLQGKRLRIIRGSMSYETITSAFADCQAKVEVLDRVDDMPALLLDTDLCITAGGSICWELMYLGVPIISHAIAENQVSILENLALENCLYYRGKTKEASQDAFLSIFEEIIIGTSDVKKIRAHGMRTFDGKGAYRILQQVREATYDK